MTRFFEGPSKGPSSLEALMESAARMGRTSELQNLLGMAPSGEAGHLIRSIEAAVCGGATKSLGMLLAHNAKLAKPWPLEELGVADAMEAALFRKDDDLVEAFAAHGAAGMTTVKGNMTPLMVAAVHDAPECFDKLLAAGADPSIVIDGVNAVFWAALGSDACLERLARLADVKTACCGQYTPLMVSACFVGASSKRGNPKACKLLAPLSDIGAVNEDGRTALMLAVKEGAWDCADILEPLGGELCLAADAGPAVEKAKAAGREDWASRLERLAMEEFVASAGAKEQRPRL